MVLHIYWVYGFTRSMIIWFPYFVADREEGHRKKDPFFRQVEEERMVDREER